MISKITQLTRFTRLSSTLFKVSPIYPTRPIFFKQIYQFSEPKKNQKPNNDNDNDNELEAQMQADLQKLKQKKDDGMKSSTFGNTVLLMGAMALVMAYAFMQIQLVRANNKKKTESKAIAKITGVGKAQIGGDWRLTGTDGKQFGSGQLQGKYYLIYFGFTHCPDICPNSLTKLSRAVAKVKKSKQASFFDLKTVFISVDPDRDTHQRIQKFVEKFDKEMIGVTGTNNQDPALRECMKKFKIYASKLQFEDQDTEVQGRKSYTIDHTILTYLMSDSNQYLTHLGANLGEHDLANLILDKINEDKREKMMQRKL